jgi:hypothetical protein
LYQFLRLVMQHVLPKGFRRARNFGFLHPNSKRLISLLKLLVFKRAIGTATPSATSQITPRAQWKCACCAGAMRVLRRHRNTVRPSRTRNTPDLSLRIAQQCPKSTVHVLDQKKPHTAQKVPQWHKAHRRRIA